MLFNLWRDLRYAVRSLGRSPGFTAATIATIALGIGLNAGVFAFVNGLLFRDVPAPDAHELVSIRQTVESERSAAGAGDGTFSTTEYVTYRDGAETLSGVLAHANSPLTTLGGEVPKEIVGSIVSCNYFAVLRQPPALGRSFTPQDCAPGADPVVVLGHELWRTAFEADPGIVGRTVELNRHPFTVVGVAAEGTYGGAPVRIGYFAPLSAEPLLRRDGARYDDDASAWLNLLGRRADGAGLEPVRAELGVIAARIDREQRGRSTTLTITRAKSLTVPTLALGPATAAAVVLMAAFGLILLIACANVANLLLARGTARSREIGIRLSLGATRARVVRQLLTESMLIAIAGGVIGCVLALWSFQALVALALPALVPPQVPISLVLDVSPDFRVLWFAAALTVTTGLVFGWVPALHASRPDLYAVVKHDAAGAGADRRGGRLRSVLVGAQVALSMVLMIAAGLLLRGLYAAYTVDVGFEYRDVAYVSLEPLYDGYDNEEAAALRQRLMEEVEALPGVEAVAYADQEPLGDDTGSVSIRLPGQGESDARRAELNAVTPDYFSVIELPIFRGRAFTAAELASRGSGERPVIVSETTARNLWPGGDAIGQTLLREGSPARVVGVAADAQVSSLGRIDPYFLYEPGGGSALLVKSRAGFDTTAAGIRATVQALDPTLALEVFPLATNLGWWRGVSVMVTTLGAALGALALVLASVGIYGVVSYAVTRRYREIGIRMALGAETRSVLAMVLRQTMRPVVVGAVIGVAAAGAMSRVLSGVMFGVSPADPLGLGGAALLVLGVAVWAGVAAAGTATRADPTATLHYE